MKKDNSLRLYIIVMFIVLVFLTTSVVIGSRADSINSIDEDFFVDISGSWVIEDDNRACFVIPEDAPNDLLLKYNSGYKSTELYCGEKLVLKTKDNEDTSCTYTYWIPIDKHESGKVILTAQNSDDLQFLISAHDYLGDTFSVMRRAITEYAVYVVFAILCLLVSLIIGIVNLSFKIRGKEYNRYNSLYLAIMVLCAGMCILTDSQFLSLFSSENQYYNLMNFVAVSFIAPSGFLFLKAFFHEEHKSISIVAGVQLLIAVAIVLLYCFFDIGIFAYLPIIYVLTLTSFIMFLIFSIREYRTYRNRLLLVILCAFVLLSVGGILTIGIYYINPTLKYNSIFTVTLFIFIVMMVIVLLRALTKYTANLEKDRIKALEEAKLMADAGNRTKTNLLQGVSHDIRTPLNSIIGYSKMMQKHIDDREIVLQCVDKIQGAGDIMSEIVDDILDINRIESGQVVINKEPLDILKLSEKLISIFRDSAEGKAIGFTSDIIDVRDRYVIADEAHVVRTLLNIISNAVKYTGPGGNVSFVLKEDDPLSYYEEENISVNMKLTGDGKAAETDGADTTAISNVKKKYYEFVISDDGRGMGREYAEKIFDPFSREEQNGISLTQGAGLGMSITKNLVEMMGGTIKIHSAQGMGTIVRVGFELDVIDELPEEKNEQSEMIDIRNILKGKRIFIVDDDARNRELLSSVLSDAGAESDECGNGDLAFEMIKAAPEDYYDLILMDIKMPYTNGIEVTKMIRQHGNSKKASIPIIGLSSDLLYMDSRNSIRAGMDDYLTKPVDEQLMIKKILELLNKSK